MDDPQLPKSRDQYGQELTLAVTFGMNATIQAFGLPKGPGDMMKVMNVAMDVANGELTLGATGAEMRLKGLDVPADIDNEAVREEKRLARIVCHYFARFLFHDFGAEE